MSNGCLMLSFVFNLGQQYFDIQNIFTLI